jgi:hypothetical protein
VPAFPKLAPVFRRLVVGVREKAERRSCQVRVLAMCFFKMMNRFDGLAFPHQTGAHDQCA